MDFDLFFKYIFPSVAISVGAYIAIRTDLASMTQRIQNVEKRAEDSMVRADRAHDRINSILEK